MDHNGHKGRKNKAKELLLPPSWPWCPTVSIVVAWVEDAEKENPPPLSRRSGSKDSGKEN
jgi:hypothetical protein